MGKAYANRKPLSERPEADFYETPKSLIWVLKEQTNILDEVQLAYEPAAGNNSLSSALNTLGIETICDDIRTTGKDFLLDNEKKDLIITNPAFSIFDDFVVQAKKVSKSFIFLGKVNFFGAYKRNNEGIWNNLKYVYLFNRQVDYRTPHRDDGLFHVGNLVTGWFVWDMEYKENYWRTSILDVQKYAKLGQYNE